ncbi:MAG: hypothetical protein H6722_03600 [Sandaracinus sp.]|nr:hypothetical protein [Sandaracinus sp.]
MTCWGANDEGQASGETMDLIGTTRAATPAGIVAMSVGDAHTCAIHGAARSLSCWGRDDSFGQLGDGTPDAGVGAGRRTSRRAFPMGPAPSRQATAAHLRCADGRKRLLLGKRRERATRRRR